MGGGIRQVKSLECLGVGQDRSDWFMNGYLWTQVVIFSWRKFVGIPKKGV